MEGIDPGLRDLAEVDRLVHEPARLMILMVLYTVESADFTFVLNVTELTDGNLSSHLSKLEAAGYVEIEKGYAGKKPRTRLRLTAEGRLRSCLFAREELDLRTLLRSGAGDEELAGAIRAVVQGKPERHGLSEGGGESGGLAMSRVGG